MHLILWTTENKKCNVAKSDPTSALITNAFYLRNSKIKIYLKNSKNNPDHLYFFFVDVLCLITLSCIFSLKSISFSCFKGQQTDPKGPLQRA